MENTKEQVVAEWKAVNEPRLKEIKSANPDLYSAINLALNYLNKKLTGEELPAEVEEEVEVIETQPTLSSQEEDYIAFTEDEIIAYEKMKPENVHGLDWSFYNTLIAGKKVSELTKDENDFKKQINEIKTGHNPKVANFYIKYYYFKPLQQSQTQQGFKVGDKVKIPLTKSVGDRYGNSNAISTAIDKGQKYLYVVKIYPGDDRIDLWYQPKNSGDYFSISEDNIELYEEPIISSTTTESTPEKKEWKPEDLVGKTLLATNGTKWSVTKLLRNNPKNKRYELVDEKGETQIYNIGFNVVKKWLDGQTAAGWKIIDEPTSKQLYTLNVETDPAQVEYNIGFKENKGDRNSPSQSAGDLKFVYGNMPDAYNTIFNTKFKGNDGQWYKINVGKGGVWTWKKA